MSGAPHAALDDLMRVARSLGPLREQVVFIGGAIAPLLQLDPPFAKPRATSDVDAILATASYSRMHEIQTSLRQLGFREDLSDPRHMHRWISPDDVPFDLVPAGQHPGATGSRWDALAIETAARAALASDLEIRHASAPAFLALKWAAHGDRGRADPLTSNDLEDLLAVLASRPDIVHEIARAPADLRDYLAKSAQRFLDDPLRDDLLAAHLGHARQVAHTVARVRDALERIAAMKG